VNAEERKKQKRAIESQIAWKKKAMESKKNIHLLKLNIRDLKQSRQNWKEKYFQARSVDKTNDMKNPSAVSIKQTKIDKKKI
jgi:hypothetical protein